MVQAVTIDDTTMLRRKAAVVGADVADDAILLDIDSGYFFQLNRTGAKIWAFVEEPQTLGALTDHMAASYKVDSDTCRSDVAEFVADLIDRAVAESVLAHRGQRGGGRQGHDAGDQGARSRGRPQGELAAGGVADQVEARRVAAMG